MSCSKNKEKNMIKEFLSFYFEQLNYNEEEWDKAKIEYSSYVKINPEENKENNYDFKNSYEASEYSKYLTENCFYKLVRDRFIPNLKLKSLKNAEYSLNEIKKEDDFYNVSVNILTDDKKYSIKIPIAFYKEKKISYIDFTSLTEIYDKD